MTFSLQWLLKLYIFLNVSIVKYYTLLSDLLPVFILHILQTYPKLIGATGKSEMTLKTQSALISQVHSWFMPEIIVLKVIRNKEQSNISAKLLIYITHIPQAFMTIFIVENHIHMQESGVMWKNHNSNYSVIITFSVFMVHCYNPPQDSLFTIFCNKKNLNVFIYQTNEHICAISAKHSSFLFYPHENV